MNRFSRSLFLAVVYVLGAQALYAVNPPAYNDAVHQAATRVLVVTNNQPNAHDASCTELFAAGFKKAGENALNVAKAAFALTSAWSLGRQYQLARNYGIKALASHPDSWPQWLWSSHRSLCLTGLLAGSSYCGYKLYCWHAAKRQELEEEPGIPALRGMAHASTGT